jgi:hypothetical protein
MDSNIYTTEWTFHNPSRRKTPRVFGVKNGGVTKERAISGKTTAPCTGL